jgi:hypothetical protein
VRIRDVLLEAGVLAHSQVLDEPNISLHPIEHMDDKTKKPEE